MPAPAAVGEGVGRFPSGHFLAVEVEQIEGQPG
jgi:hypothetical protein